MKRRSAWHRAPSPERIFPLISLEIINSCCLTKSDQSHTASGQNRSHSSPAVCHLTIFWTFTVLLSLLQFNIYYGPRHVTGEWKDESGNILKDWYLLSCMVKYYQKCPYSKSLNWIFRPKMDFSFSKALFIYLNENKHGVKFNSISIFLSSKVVPVMKSHGIYLNIYFSNQVSIRTRILLFLS